MDTKQLIATLEAIEPIGNLAALKELPPENELSPKHLEALGLLSRRHQEDLRCRRQIPYRLRGGRVRYNVGEFLAWYAQEGVRVSL